MKPDRFKSDLLNKSDEELSLSGSVLSELLRAVLEKGVPFRFRAKGFSMLPFIKDGDVVTVSPLFDTKPHLGDVLAFMHPRAKKLFVHRMIGKEGNSCMIRGDNTLEMDGLVALANILGRVTRVERNGKRILLGLGPERWLIAFLTRRKLLFPLMVPIWRLVPPLIKSWVR